MGKIFIRDLEVECIIGCQPLERKKKRKVVFNIELEADLSKPAETDNIEDAVNYWDVTQKVISFVEGTSFFLLERLAASVGEMILKEFLVNSVKISVDKPGVVPSARAIGIEIIIS